MDKPYPQLPPHTLFLAQDYRENFDSIIRELDYRSEARNLETLAENLAASPFAPETFAVCGMLRDKDIAGVLREMAPRITQWHLASLPGPRGASAQLLETSLRENSPHAAGIQHDAVQSALAAALEAAGENDKIRSEEHTSELQSLTVISYAVVCL